MVDTFTNNYNLVLQQTGTNGGTWGTDWNNNGTTPIDAILGATQSVVMSSGNITLTLSQWQNAAFKITGTLTANVQLILPLSPNSVGGTPGVGGKFVVDNQTTGAFTVTVLTAATGSTGVVAPQGFRTLLYSDTVNVWYVNPVGPASLTTLAASGAATFASTVSITGKLSLTSTDSMAMANGTTGQRNGSPNAGDVRYNSTLGCLEYYSGALALWVALGVAPTVQRFTASGGFTYTPSTGVIRAKARIKGGGGGGAGTTAATQGTTTSLGGWTAIGGFGASAPPGGSLYGSSPGQGGNGGANGSGTLVNRWPGAPGQTGYGNSSNANRGGGSGGGKGGGPGTGTQSGTVTAGLANSGGGGSGIDNGVQPGAGGGEGEEAEFWMTAAQIGGGLSGVVGAGGAAGTGAANGGSGYVVIEEFYS
jgi:hypothetical protein